MAQQELKQTASFLIQALQIDLPPDQLDIFQPTILIECLKRLFPDSQSIWTQICQQFDVEQRWSTVIEFIQINMLDNASIQFEDLGVQELLELYMLVAQFVEEKIQEQEQMQLKPKKQEKRKNQKGSLKAVNEKEKSKSKGKEPPKQKIESGKGSEAQRKKASSERINMKSEKVKDANSKHYQPNEKQKNQSKPRAVQTKNLQEELLDGIKKIISKPVHKPNLKRDVLMKDQKGTEAVAKAKRQFDYFMKDFERERKMKRKLKPYLKDKIQKNNVDEHFLKILTQKQKNIEEEVTNQQLKYFMALRDRKVAFVNKIHRLTEQLERERQIDWAHQQRQMMQKQRQKVKQQIQRTEGLFEKNMDLLKKQYRDSKVNQEKQQCDELNICKQMGKAVEKRKLEELDVMRVLWEQENAKLNNIMGDQQKTKNKLIDLYRKNRP